MTNASAAAGGADEETVEEAKRRAPAGAQGAAAAPSPPTTSSSSRATRRPTSRRAKALPLHHPDFPGVAVPGAVTVIVVPDVDGAAPRPSEGTLRTVCLAWTRTG